ncbi:hypothetical protein GGR57DRAFT_311917 [Xylariaceae sp. FL1272]|nr:hypothetical protein GGR57DRAFT_311917 [Xylariaceae sp. FL1272]
MSRQDGVSVVLSGLLTLILTTSPTPSAPGTDLISEILESFKLHCPILRSCNIIVVFDTYERIGPEMRLKKGMVTAEGATAFNLYKSNVKDLIMKEYQPKDSSNSLINGKGQAEYGLPNLANGLQRVVPFSTLQTQDKRVTFIEPSERVGFGLGVRSALRMTETPYVWIQQHDWSLIRDIPLLPMLHVMRASDEDTVAPIKYVCLPSVRMQCYATSGHVTHFPVLRELTAKLKRDFLTPSSPEDIVPLTPLFFWHDKPHIASTAHYLSRIFPTPLAMGRGDFIEDTVGQRARTQMKEGIWSKWACWLFYPEDGEGLCLKHLNGRKWRGMEGALAQKQLWLETGTKRKKNGPALPSADNGTPSPTP